MRLVLTNLLVVMCFELLFLSHWKLIDLPFGDSSMGESRHLLCLVSPLPTPLLRATVPRREVLVINGPQQQSARLRFFSTQRPHQQRDDRRIDFLRLGAPTIQELHVCLQQSLSV